MRWNLRSPTSIKLFPRHQYIKVLTNGLDQDELTTNAILRLLGLPLLKHDEITEYTIAHRQNKTHPCDNSNLWPEIVRLITRASEDISKRQRTQTGKITLFPHRDVVLGEEAVCRMEETAGQMRGALEYPPNVFCDEHLIRAVYHHTSQRDWSLLRDIHLRRMSALNKTLRVYGARIILCKPSIIWQLDENNDVDAHERELLRRLLMRVADYMEEYEHLSIRFDDETPSLEFESKGIGEAFIQGSGGYSYTERSRRNWGPLYIHLKDEPQVLNMVCDFEDAWTRINTDENDRDAVIAWLRSHETPTNDEESEDAT